MITPFDMLPNGKRSCFSAMLALAERHVGDLAKAGAVMVQRPDMAPVHLIRAVAEVVGAERGQPGEYGVDLGLALDEGGERGGVGPRHVGALELVSGPSGSGSEYAQVQSEPEHYANICPFPCRMGVARRNRD